MASRVGQGAARHPSAHRTAPSKELPGPNVDGAEVQKPAVTPVPNLYSGHRAVVSRQGRSRGGPVPSLELKLTR